MCPGMQKESLYNLLRASLISLFSSSDAITLCFHMEIYRSININGCMPYGLRRKTMTKKLQIKHLRTSFFSAALLCKAVLKLQHNQ